MLKAGTRDMTSGSILSQLVAFSLPVIIGDLVQQLYSIADTIIVGRLLGVDALAAVGVTGSLVFMMIGFVQGVSAGVCVITSQKFGSFSSGSGSKEDLEKSLNTVIFLGVAVTIVMTTFSLILARPLLQLMNTPDNIIDFSISYCKVLFAGLFATCYYNTIACILRSLGDSRTPLLFLIVASLMNIVLDVVFIAVFGMGVKGAAFATVLAQLISAVLCTFYARKRFELIRGRLRKMFDTDFGLCKEHLRTGIPMGLQFFVTAIGVIMFQKALNAFGSVAIAGLSAAMKVENLVSTTFFALGSSMAVFAGQNIGANRPDRVKQGVRITFWVGAVLSIVAGVLMLVFGRAIIGLFVSKDVDPEVFEYGMTFNRIVAPTFLLLHILVMYRNTLQGLGYGFIPFLGGVLECLSRAFCAGPFSKHFGYPGVCMLEPTAWLATSAVLFVTYRLWCRKVRLKELQSSQVKA